MFHHAEVQNLAKIPRVCIQRNRLTLSGPSRRGDPTTVMMASMAQPFAHPGGMPGHAGLPHGGHPMGPGHPPNQGVPGGGQPGVTMGQQMHPGMVTGPQVTQAGPMMPPGSGAPGVSIGGPSAHALSHLNPSHPQQMYQQQQMQQVSKFII